MKAPSPKIIKRIKTILVLVFGILIIILTLRYFSGIIQGKYFWAVGSLLNFFVVPKLQMKYELAEKLAQRTMLELILMIILLLDIVLRTSKDFIKSIPADFKEELKNN